MDLYLTMPSLERFVDTRHSYVPYYCITISSACTIYSPSYQMLGLLFELASLSASARVGPGPEAVVSIRTFVP